MSNHDTVVVKDGGGSSTGLILGIVAIILIVAAVWYFALGPGAGGTTNTNDGPTINVNLPSVAPAAT
jgi:hypothetical protein